MKHKATFIFGIIILFFLPVISVGNQAPSQASNINQTISIPNTYQDKSTKKRAKKEAIRSYRQLKKKLKKEDPAHLAISAYNLSLISLVLIFVFAPVAFIVAISAKRKAKRAMTMLNANPEVEDGESILHEKASKAIRLSNVVLVLSAIGFILLTLGLILLFSYW